jgi:hypothetical protein
MELKRAPEWILELGRDGLALVIGVTANFTGCVGGLALLTAVGARKAGVKRVM